MGLVDRLNKIARGAGRFTADTFDAGWDAATAAWDRVDDVDFEDIGHLLRRANGNRLTRAGFASTGGIDFDIVDVVKRYGGGALKETGSFLNYAFGEPVRMGFRGMETAYREGVSEPVSQLMTAASLIDDPNFQKRLAGKSFGEKVGDIWHESSEIAEDRSPGQAIWLAIGTKSITDEAEVEETEANPWFSTVTGMTDAAFQIFADPFDSAVDVVKIARGRKAYREVADLALNGVNSKAGERIARYVEDTVAEHGAEQAPAIIRHRLFPSRTVRDGDTVSSLLVQASTRRTGEMDLLLRTFAGDGDAFDLLSRKAPYIADTAASAMAGAQDYVSIVNDTMTDFSGAITTGRRIVPPGSGTHGEAAMNLSLEAAERANAELTYIEGVRDLFGVWNKAPHLTARGAAREFTHTQFFQKNPLFRPVRVLNGMKPNRALNVHSSNLDVQIQRAMEEIGASVDEQRLYRSAMLDARTAGERGAVINQTHEFIINKVADDIGLAGPKRDRFLEQIKTMREDARRAASTTFTGSDGVERLWMMDDDGVAQLVEAPALSSHLSNYEWLPNTRRLKYMAEKVKKGRQVHPGELADDALTTFYALWKPATLLGFRTPIRVGTDEIARRIADMGAVAVGQDIAKQIGSKLGLATRAGEDWVRGAADEFAPAFGETGDNIFRQNLAETARPGPFYGRGEGGLYSADFGLRDWRSIKATDEQFDAAYHHAVNTQIPASPIARRLMENGMDRDEVIEWLRTGDGWHVMRTADHARQFDPEGWVDEIASQVEWVLPTDELRAAALRGEANVDDYIAMFGTRDATPPVHGQYLRDVVTGQSKVQEAVRGVTDKLMTNLNSKPTIFLQRQPHFARKYAEEVRRLEQVALREGVELTDELAMSFEKRARRYALEQVRDLLFDMAETSSVADTFRFIAPFGNASREVLTRWAGIVWRDPSIARRLQQVWSSPEKAGLIIDGNGNQILGDGRARTPDGEIVDAEGERYVRFQIPSGLPLPSSLKPAGGSVRFSKDSFNTILANPFGVGPTVSMAASVLLKDRPDIQESLKFIFPYGVPKNIVDAVKPTSIRRLTDRDGDHSYEASKIYYFNSLYAQWAESGGRLHDGETKEQRANKLWKQAEETAKSVANVRFMASLVLPVQPSFTSPYEPYIAIYRRYQKEDPTTASLRFAEDYGTELLSLTTSITKAVNGVPPTLEGWRGYRKNKDAIDADPELGRVILGEVGGEFSRAVYQQQLRTGQRVRRTKEEVMAAPEIEAGWQTYTKAMDGIEAARIARGLPSLRVKRAEKLAAAKRQITDVIREQYPAWAESFDTIDPNRTARRVDDMRRIINSDPDLRGRNDIQGLEKYIELRDDIIDTLRQRAARGKPSSLDANANRDLRSVWETERARIVKNYIAFGPLFYRYFEFDNPKAA